MSEVMLLAREDVQKELELVDDQLEQFGEARENIDMREMFSQVRDLPSRRAGSQRCASSWKGSRPR